MMANSTHVQTVPIYDKQWSKISLSLSLCAVCFGFYLFYPYSWCVRVCIFESAHQFAHLLRTYSVWRLFIRSRAHLYSAISHWHTMIISFFLCKLLYTQIDIPAWFQSFCVFRCVCTDVFSFIQFIHWIDKFGFFWWNKRIRLSSCWKFPHLIESINCGARYLFQETKTTTTATANALSNQISIKSEFKAIAFALAALNRKFYSSKQNLAVKYVISIAITNSAASGSTAIIVWLSFAKQFIIIHKQSAAKFGLSIIGIFIRNIHLHEPIHKCYFTRQHLQFNSIFTQ